MKIFIYLVVFGIACSPLISCAAPTPTERYDRGKNIHILIVPGHDSQYSGAVFNGITEAELNLKLAEELKLALEQDSQIKTTIARDREWYISKLDRYFQKSERAVGRFIEKNKQITNEMLDDGNIEMPDQVPHNNAPGPVVYRLYAINKWIDEQDYDLAIHIHFNDDGTRRGTKPGSYTGYTIYAPSDGLLNAKQGTRLGNAIGHELERVISKSNLPDESTKANEYGVVPDFKLIALGANRTLKAPSVLVEYSYIYEPQVIDTELYPSTAQVFAQATARGVFDYLRNTESKRPVFSYEWKNNLEPVFNKSTDAIMLEYALKSLGYYPPKNSLNNNCVMDGIYGACTSMALKEFQTAKKIKADGMFGQKTRQALNTIFEKDE